MRSRHGCRCGDQPTDRRHEHDASAGLTNLRKDGLCHSDLGRHVHVELRDKSSRESPSTGPFTMMPALLTTPFNVLGSWSESFAMEALSAMSRAIAWTLDKPIEAIQRAVGSSGGVDVPPSLAHVFGDRQTDASAGAGNQYGWHASLSRVELQVMVGTATNDTDRCTKKLAVTIRM